MTCAGGLPAILQAKTALGDQGDAPSVGDLYRSPPGVPALVFFGASRTTAAKSPDKLEVRIIREQPTDGEMTLARNLLAGYEHTRSDTIVFCESQSWYRDNYLETKAV